MRLIATIRIVRVRDAVTAHGTGARSLALCLIRCCNCRPQMPAAFKNRLWNILKFCKGRLWKWV